MDKNNYQKNFLNQECFNLELFTKMERKKETTLRITLMAYQEFIVLTRTTKFMVSITYSTSKDKLKMKFNTRKDKSLKNLANSFKWDLTNLTAIRAASALMNLKTMTLLSREPVITSFTLIA